MIVLLFIALLAVPIVELWIIIQVSGEIGLPLTLAVLVIVSMAGAWLLKQQGMATWRRLQTTLRQGRAPTQEATDGALILIGGALLLTPGFLTDLFGFLLLLPPTRAAVKGSARRAFGRWARRRTGWRGGAYGRDVHPGHRGGSPKFPPRAPLPPERGPADEAGSRDTD